MQSAQNPPRLEPKPQPKVVVLDLPYKVTDAIKTNGFNVCAGNLGSWYPVTASGKQLLLTLDYKELPLHEQEVFFIGQSGLVQASPPAKLAHGARGVWTDATSGVIDSRPLVMQNSARLIDNAVKNGGAVIFVASPLQHTTYATSTADHRGEPHEGEITTKATAWSVLYDSDRFNVTDQAGSEIRWGESELSRLIKNHAEGAKYDCYFSFEKREGDRFTPLATDKFGNVIAAEVISANDSRPVLILPVIPRMDSLAVDLLNVWVPKVAPKVCPWADGKRWHNQPEYDAPEALVIVQEREEIVKEREALLAAKDQEITATRRRYSHEATLMSGTGDELCQAVIIALRELGFKDVVDVDEHVHQSRGGQNIEDIWIKDRTITVIVDVKGPTMFPSDADCEQCDKHARMRAKEWKTHDIQGLTISNWLRNTPPYQRNGDAFRQEVIDAAEQGQYGLMTTWDLVLLLRNKRRNNWPTSSVLDIFYRTGRIDPVPSHYEFLGVIEKTYNEAFSIKIIRALPPNSRLAVEVDGLVHEFKAKLQIERQSVESADTGQSVGVAFSRARELLKTSGGQRVFLVAQTAK